MATRIQRSLMWIFAAMIAALVTGCGSPDITPARLGADIARNFPRQYREQRRLEGRSRPTERAVHAHVSCTKGGDLVPDRGPGKDWVCVVSWIDASGVHQKSSYEVNARTEACYTATDPALTAQHQFVTRADGTQVDNPLYQFDGCFDVT